jgi:two-component system CheB/CheR fusion protein
MSACSWNQSHTPSLRVLILEDYPYPAASLAILLRMEGHDVRICSTGSVALAAAAAYRPDAALIDIMLPGMDGYKVSRCLGEQGETRDTLLIAVTGFADEAHRRRSKDAGFAHYYSGRGAAIGSGMDGRMLGRSNPDRYELG